MTAETAKRYQAVKLADAINAIEGVPVSQYAIDLSHMWADGNLSGEQMISALLARYKSIYRMEDDA